MIANHNHGRNTGVDNATGSEPFGPLKISRCAVNEITGMKEKARVRCLTKSCPDHPRPVRKDTVLGIAKVRELDWAGSRRSTSLNPFTPSTISPSHAVSVQRVWLQTIKYCGVIVHNTKTKVIWRCHRHAIHHRSIQVNRLCACNNRRRYSIESGVCGGWRDLGNSRSDIAVRAPIYRYFIGRCSTQILDYAVGPQRRLLPWRYTQSRTILSNDH